MFPLSESLIWTHSHTKAHYSHWTTTLWSHISVIRYHSPVRASEHHTVVLLPFPMPLIYVLMVLLEHPIQSPLLSESLIWAHQLIVILEHTAVTVTTLWSHISDIIVLSQHHTVTVTNLWTLYLSSWSYYSTLQSLLPLAELLIWVYSPTKAHYSHCYHFLIPYISNLIILSDHHVQCTLYSDFYHSPNPLSKLIVLLEHLLPLSESFICLSELIVLLEHTAVTVTTP